MFNLANLHFRWFQNVTRNAMLKTIIEWKSYLHDKEKVTCNSKKNDYLSNWMYEFDENLYRMYKSIE